MSQLGKPPAADRLYADIAALRERLDDAQRDTRLPGQPTAEAAINELIIRTRSADGSFDGGDSGDDDGGGDDNNDGDIDGPR